MYWSLQDDLILTWALLHLNCNPFVLCTIRVKLTMQVSDGAVDHDESSQI